MDVENSDQIYPLIYDIDDMGEDIMAAYDEKELAEERLAADKRFEEFINTKPCTCTGDEVCQSCLEKYVVK